MNWRRWLEWGGYAAGAVLIAFGIAVIALALNGRSTVHNSLKDEKITGTPDMTPAAIKEEAAQAGLKDISLPSCSVCRQGDRQRRPWRCRAVHAGSTRWRRPAAWSTPSAALRDDDGKGTNDAAKASKGPSGLRSTTPRGRSGSPNSALDRRNVSYMADQLALFSLVVGIALLLTGVGFIILAAGGALRRTTAAARPGRSSSGELRLREENQMGFDQYHEPAAETQRGDPHLRADDRVADRGGRGDRLVRQRMSLEPDPQAKAIMANAQLEEFKHFGMDLEFPAPEDAAVANRPATGDPLHRRRHRRERGGGRGEAGSRVSARGIPLPQRDSARVQAVVERPSSHARSARR